jgi:hypothetical protein
MSSAPQVADRAVLDPRQLTRIEAVHRGFMYQHLFAVGCLLLARGHTAAVTVEHDEDVQLHGEASTYIQIKTRNRPLIAADIDGALERFATLRAEHQSDRRSGRPQFAIAANIAPAAGLRNALQAQDFPQDVSVV